MKVAVCGRQWLITFDTKPLCSVWIMSVFHFSPVVAPPPPLPPGGFDETLPGRRQMMDERRPALLTPAPERRPWSRRTPSSPSARRTPRWRTRPRWTGRPRRRSPPGCPRCPRPWSPCSASAGCPSVASRRCHCERRRSVFRMALLHPMLRSGLLGGGTCVNCLYDWRWYLWLTDGTQSHRRACCDTARTLVPWRGDERQWGGRQAAVERSLLVTHVSGQPASRAFVRLGSDTVNYHYSLWHELHLSAANARVRSQVFARWKFRRVLALNPTY